VLVVFIIGVHSVFLKFSVRNVLLLLILYVVFKSPLPTFLVLSFLVLYVLLLVANFDVVCAG